MVLRRVVVTGLGALTPIGNNIEEYWNGLINGVSGAAPITYFDASKFKTQFACELKNFNAEDFLDRKEARKLDRYAQYAMVSSDEAVRDADFNFEKLDKDRVGVIWGSGIGGLETFQIEMLNFAAGDGTPKFNPFFIPKMISDIAGGHISIKYGFRGPNFTTVSACASSTNAIIDAFNYIRLGHADAMITGGSEAAVTIAGMGGFNAMHALSTRNDDPKTASRPMDKDRDGFVLGEGAGALVLEEYEHAKKRGAKIYAELVGFGMSSDAYHMTSPPENGAGAALAMANALRDAGIEASQIGYVNAHGTSTPAGDKAEAQAVKTIFGEAASRVLVSSTKSMTGHLLGAAGAVESIYSILALRDQAVPPTINLDNPDEGCDLDFVPHEARQVSGLEYTLCNSFGFGGTNGSLIFKKV